MPNHTQPTEEDIKHHTEIINKMTRLDMCELWRFAPPGHPYFDRTLPYFDIFDKRFTELGRFSPGISKAIGWSP